MRRAYQSLSHGLQSLVEKMTAQHSAVRMVELNNRHKFNVKMEAIPDPVTHPVVRTDISDIPSLYVNPIYTVGFSGMTPTESEPLLEFLYTPATQHQNIYRHRWQKGDVTIFDNRCTMYYLVIDYGPEMHRLMYRTTVAMPYPSEYTLLISSHFFLYRPRVPCSHVNVNRAAAVFIEFTCKEGRREYSQFIASSHE